MAKTIGAITTADLSARVAVDAPSDLSWLEVSFNSLLERLEKAFHFQRQFMADASHELRTPLTVALSATQVTRRDRLSTPEECEETLSLVEQQIHKLSNIVDNLLFLSRADSSSLQMERHKFYLDDVLSDAARSARALAKAKQQTLQLTELPEAPCMGDESLINQAVLILLDNAVKYTPVAGEISVALLREQANWRCRVWNSGPGIPAAAQTHIFERFYRAQSGKDTKVSGSGLGLPIARSIAELHGGTLRLLESGVNGTTFELSLPVLMDDESETQNYAKSLAVKI